MDRNNHPGPGPSSRSSSFSSVRDNRGGEDLPDILVPPFLTPSTSSSFAAQGNERARQPSGNESSDSRKWFHGISSIWTKRNNKVLETQTGPVTHLGPTENLYNMNYPMRGKCVILNHTMFDKSQHLSERDGSEVDVEKIQSVFKNFGFTIVTYQNLKYDQIVYNLQQIAREDHSQSDCLIVFVLTHGQTNQLHAYDTTYKPSSLWGFFTADKCSTLAGKPKMFFVQACRGDLYDDGTELSMSFSRTQVDGPQRNEEYGYRIPNQADFLTVFSTYEAAQDNNDLLRFTMQYLSLGYFSWRNSRRGSCFIQALCKIVEDTWQSKDVLSMMTLVNREVAIQYESRSKDPAQNMKKQIPHVCHTLMRDIYLTPKIHSTLV